MIAQIFAVVIFLAMFILIITEVWERHIVTLGCALLTLILVFGICMHSPFPKGGERASCIEA